MTKPFEEDWDDAPEEEDLEPPVRTARTRAAALALRRRIEELQEVRRMRELLDDDDFDFN